MAEQSYRDYWFIHKKVKKIKIPLIPVNLAQNRASRC